MQSDIGINLQYSSPTICNASFENIVIYALVG